LLVAGRKVLSRAFRSRFLELAVTDLPPPELATILERRCALPPSYAARLVDAMRELQCRRTHSTVFAGRHGLITARDLFRWAARGAIGYEELALNGYLLLAERLRTPGERDTVKQVRCNLSCLVMQSA
jgi:midasin